MISSIEIKNYKLIERLSLEKLQRLTVVGGKNGCGKSSLLESIFLMFDRMNPHLTMRGLMWRGLGNIPVDPEYVWAPIFHKFNLGADISVKSQYKGKEKGVSLKVVNNAKRSITAPSNLSPFGAPISNVQSSIPQSALSIEFTENKKPVETSKLFLDSSGMNLDIQSSIGKPTIATYFPSRQPSNPVEDAERLGHLEINNQSEQVVEILRDVIPEIKSITAVRLGANSIIYADVGGERKTPISSLGEGVSRLLSVALGIAACKDGIVLIDEIENGLHYSVHSAVWRGIAKASEKFNCQVICTTHSQEFLSAANSAMKEIECTEFCYVRLSKTNGCTTGKYFDREMLDFALDTEIEVR